MANVTSAIANATVVAPPEELPFTYGLAVGLFFSVGIISMFNIVSYTFYKVMDMAALNSDKAVQTEGSLTRTNFIYDEYGGIASRCFHYEFHVPQPRKRSSLQRMLPAGNLGPCGASCTGKADVSEAKFNQYSAKISDQPVDCVVRYVAGDPRRNALHSIGDDVEPYGFTMLQFVMKEAVGFIVAGVFSGFAFYYSITAMSREFVDEDTGTTIVWATGTTVGFVVLVSICILPILVMHVRARMRLPPCPGTRCKEFKDPKYADFVLTKLDTPYVKPTRADAAPVAVVAAAVVPATAVEVVVQDGAKV